MQHITVAYATMSDYYYYICVSMMSILRTARADTFVDFVVLHGADFTVENQAGMQRIMDKYGRHSLRFIDVSQYAFNDTHTELIAKATYYRLVLAEVLDAGRCLYLDGDTIVCEDLQELYHTDMEGNCLAGVKAVAYHRDEMNVDRSRVSQLPDFREYINAGVLLMDLDAMRKRHLTKEFLRRMAMDLPSQDQDVLNGACYGSIKFLPPKYNAMTKYAGTLVDGYCGCFTREEILESWNRPAIIHYADKWKPWNIPHMVFGDLWWRVCRMDEDVFSYFYLRARDTFLYDAAYAHIAQPRFADAAFAGPLMIWGAGQVAREVVANLWRRGVTPLCCLVSDGYGRSNPEAIAGIPVREASAVSEHASGVTLLLAVKEEFRREVYFTAERMGFRRILFSSAER